jgi:hypothetical protein
VPFLTGTPVGLNIKAYTLFLNEDGTTVDTTLLANEWNLGPDGTLTFEALDSDQDGVGDRNDNCTLVANADQRDSNGDGFGNICDGDFNGDCIVNRVDKTFLQNMLHTSNPHADLNGDGIVNGLDANILVGMRGDPPGPSGLPNSCTP